MQNDICMSYKKCEVICPNCEAARPIFESVGSGRVKKKAAEYQICDVIEIVDKSKIENSENVENGECFIVIHVFGGTEKSEGFISIIDNDAEELVILESEFGGIRWIA